MGAVSASKTYTFKIKNKELSLKKLESILWNGYMEYRNLLAICITLIIIVLISVGTYVFLNSSVDTTLVANDGTLFDCRDPFSITLTDAKDNPLANKTVKLNLTKYTGEETHYDLVTDAYGKASINLTLTEGNYSVIGTFEGDNDYNPSSFNQSIMIRPNLFNSNSNSNSNSNFQGETPESEYLVYDGEYKYFTDLIDGEYVTELIGWDHKAGCYHW